MKKNTLANIFLLIMCIVFFFTCTQDNDDALGPSPHPDLIPSNAFDSTPPDNATIVSPDTFSSMLDDESLTLVTMNQIVQENESAREEEAAQRALALQLYNNQPDILDRHTFKPDPMNPDYRLLPDGNVEFRIQEADPQTGQEEEYVVLLGNRYTYAELVQTAERFHTKENQDGIYTELYTRLSDNFKQINELQEPEIVANHTLDMTRIIIRRITDNWTTITLPGDSMPPEYPAGAWEEEGHGGIDGAWYAPHTGMWPLISFPLKWYVTSIKNQGNRGTCPAFGITAAVETVVARDQHRWVNLSEQMLYNRAKQIWWPSTHGDGVNTEAMLMAMFINQYRYSWEQSWDYNFSFSRINLGSFYMLSCTGYTGEHCSDTNHQATMVCTDFMGTTYCGCLDPANDVPADAWFGIVSYYPLGYAGQLNLALVKTTLAVQIPVIISVTVPYTLKKDHVPPIGIITHVGIADGSGGHCMLLVGYIRNEDLPPGTPHGSGGGYFICKNSWGGDYGDGGYCYLPDNWVLQWTRGFWALNLVGEF